MSPVFALPVSCLLWLTVLFVSPTASGQPSALSRRIDSLLSAQTAQPFNGVLFVVQQGRLIYRRTTGYADLARKTPLKPDDQFVIGSISKQLTGVLVLRAYERGRLALHRPIRTYLPDLTQPWADSVTVHHLLTHTHGIVSLVKPLAFRPGAEYQYSQLGYELLARIVERTSQQSFADVSAALFGQCAMTRTVHPGLKQHRPLVSGYSEQADSRLLPETESLQNFVAAGSFISTAPDLLTWNAALHGGKLLHDSTYRLMLKKYSARNHPLFGLTEYGYGITVGEPGGLRQLGQTGYAPGFVSMDYYFPESQTSLVVLSNVAYGGDDLREAFFYHLQLLKILRESLPRPSPRR